MASGTTVAVFGAGASMAAGGIGLDQILTIALAEEASPPPRRGLLGRLFANRPDVDWRQRLREFLGDVFGAVDPDWPNFGLVLSIVDLSISRGQGLVSISRGRHTPSRAVWHLKDLPDIREKLEGAIIWAVLQKYLDQFEIHEKPDLSDDQLVKGFVHELFLDYLFQVDEDFSLVSMNYDMFLDRAAVQHLERFRSERYRDDCLGPNYDVEFSGRVEQRLGPRLVHKVHGSLDWAHCSGCGRIRLLHTAPYLQSVGEHNPAEKTLAEFSDELVADTPTVCSDCQSDLRPMIIPPTLLKNYSNTHIRHVWSHAEVVLRDAERLFFVGYSLPPDDIEFVAMLKRHTQNVARQDIHVISPDESALSRYRSVFGPDIDIQKHYFQDWVRLNKDHIPTFDSYRTYRTTREEMLPLAPAK